jgi:hypothetical protein
MILTPIPRAALPAALDRFAARLHDRAAASAFAHIRATAPDRAVGAEVDMHRRAALALAAGFGIAVHPPGTECRYNWDGAALDGSSEAYVILHEVAHFVLAPTERRSLVDFGLGPGPDTRDRETARRAAILSLVEREEDEALASLLGILWEAELGQPALASFLDQNWLEGLDRSAAPHFTAVLAGLGRRGLVDARARPVIPSAARRPARSDKAKVDRGRRDGRASAAERGCLPDPVAGGREPAGAERRSG